MGYTQTGRTITYDPNTSTQLEFTDVYINNIIARTLKFWGINMAEQDIQQFAQLQTQEKQLYDSLDDVRLTTEQKQQIINQINPYIKIYMI